MAGGFARAGLDPLDFDAGGVNDLTCRVDDARANAVARDKGYLSHGEFSPKYCPCMRRRLIRGLFLTREVLLEVVPVNSHLTDVLAESVDRQGDNHDARREEPDVEDSGRPEARIELPEAHVECREAHEWQHERHGNQTERDQDLDLTRKL